MSWRASRLGLVLLALTVAALAQSALAQPAVSVGGPPASGALRHLTPTFIIGTSGFTGGDPVATLRLRIGTRSDLGVPLFADTTVPAAEATIRLQRPLPQDSPLYWSVTARTQNGLEVHSPTTGPRTTVPWLRLVAPNEPNGTTIGSRQPPLVWTSGTVDSPPGPWRFDVAVTNAATRQIVVSQTVSDTSFVPPSPLESNTSYRWRVTARLGATDSVTRQSDATFVIADTDAPLATLLYQSFPNPFPTPASQTACIWFDLHQPALVTLEVFNIRGSLVRRLIPGDGISSTLRAGRYGRESGSDDTGCDPRFAWDGSSEDGRIVPSGVYLVRMRAGEKELVKKILFRGR